MSWEREKSLSNIFLLVCLDVSCEFMALQIWPITFSSGWASSLWVSVTLAQWAKMALMLGNKPMRMMTKWTRFFLMALLHLLAFSVSWVIFLFIYACSLSEYAGACTFECMKVQYVQSMKPLCCLCNTDRTSNSGDLQACRCLRGIPGNYHAGWGMKFIHFVSYFLSIGCPL